MRRFQDLRSRLISTAFKRINRLAPSKKSKAYRRGMRTRIWLHMPPYTAMNRYKPGTAKFDAFEAGFIFASNQFRKAPTK